MTNSDLTLIAVLVDRSGSMSACRADMEGGINTFLDEQAAQPGQAEVALAQFDDHYELVWPIKPIAEKTDYRLVPRGCTALLDGMGKFITEIGEELAARAEADRPGKVIMVIVTDGYENSSREWSRAQIKELVTQQQDQWGWEFVFLGANMDAVAEGGSFGLSANSSLTYDVANAGGVLRSASAYVSSLRATGDASFSEDDRAAAVQ